MYYQTLLAFLIVLFYSIAYRVSLYSLAVNLDPDELESLYDNISEGQKRFLEQIARDPQDFMQVGVVYKAISLVAITVVAVLLLISIPIEMIFAKLVTWSLSLLTVWIGYVLIVEYLPRRSSRTAINSQMIGKLWYLRIITFFDASNSQKIQKRNYQGQCCRTGDRRRKRRDCRTCHRSTCRAGRYR